LTWSVALYFLALRALGAGLTIGALVLAASRGLNTDIGLLIALGVMASWLRFKLKPIGHVSLIPLVIFVSLLRYESYVPLLVGSLSALIGVRFFGRSGWDLSAEVAGEEGLSTILLVATFHLMSSRSVGYAFAVGVGAYLFGHMILTAIRGKLQEDVSLASTVLNAGKDIVGNYLLLSIVAFGIAQATPIVSRFGLLGLGLVTIALVEFYRPWKLLSQQADDLFTNLAIIAEAIDIKDPYTGRHSRRVAKIAVKLARRMDLPEQEVDSIRIGALLHDIGKIGVSGSIIRKPASLEATEIKAMQRHPVISASIMQPVEYFREAAVLVRHHHEHYDGSGYPDGRKAEDIPIGSRIILVADAFDAMTTDRPYRTGRSKQEAVATLKDRAGKQFDSRVVSVLEEIIQEI
jgi:putative nucleotidyltransferase with HDIG domain